ncbi:MAG TPA: tetratricopeptide repeat protein [Burkholderiaceae bacterium]|nr:tetratricopeptide repeat protein [Burkholderiaceae bacterium]
MTDCHIPRRLGAAPMSRIAGAPAPLRVLASALTALALGAAISACSSAPAHGQQPAAPAAGAPAPDTEGANAPSEALPDVDLTSELLFRLMYAEIAVQRGEPAAAFTELMEVARQTRDPRIARRATEVAIGARALPQALEAAALWRSLAPADVEADQSYSSLLVANGKYDQARPLLERQIAASPNPLEILDRLQRVLSHAPEPAKGFALLEAVAQKYAKAPDTAFDVQLILARGAHAAGDDRAAVAHARAALAVRPNSELAVITVVQLLVEGGGPPAGNASSVSGKDQNVAARVEAMSVLVKFLEAHPEAADVRQVYARLLVGEGHLEEARQQFEELLQQSPKNLDPLFALGVLSLEAERYSEARGYFERYLDALGPSTDRDLDLVYMNMARVAEGEHHFEEALQWLRKVRGPDQIDAARERQAFVLGRMNRVEEGLQMLEQLPADTPEERTQRILAKGQLLRDAHRYEESFALLDDALKTNPDDTGLLYESAMSAERLDRIDVMEARLRHLLQLHPDYAHAYNALGYSLADRNIRLPEAYQLINQALTLAPDDGFIVDSMGWVQYRMGNLSAARETLTRAFQLKADPDVAAHLGEVLWATGDHTGARELLLDAQKRDGESDTLRDTLQRLKIQP